MRKNFFKCRKVKIVSAVMLTIAMFMGCGGDKTAEDRQENQSSVIGVSVYNPADAEVKAFRNYFENYLGEAFDVSFQYSDGILETDEELAFIDELHKVSACEKP